MKFKYKARNADGELQTGFVDSDTKPGAINILTSHGLFLLSIESADIQHWYDFWLAFINRVKQKDVMVFSRQFATVLSAKIPLADALVTLRKQTRNPILKDVLSEVVEDIDAGLSLSQALEKHGNVFSVFYVNMIRSAELTGRVEEAVNFLADYIEKEVALTSKVKNAMIYPAIMITLFFFVALFISGFVLPKIAPIFAEAKVDLPVFTKMLLGFSGFTAKWWWAIIAAALSLGVLVSDYMRSPEGKSTVDEISMRIPVFGKLLKGMYVARFAESVSILVKGGISIPQAIEVTGYTVGSNIYRDLLHEASESIRKGENLSQALARNEEYFPPLLVQMVAIGETTGKLDDMLSRSASFYTREVNELVGSLVELIQPLLMVFIGISVAVLFASILIPIFDLAQKI